jgi:murein DD-endopeptidase MepM/ murein hydrolase activator NlpD
MNLQERIDNITTEYPDEDEYILDIDSIGHDAIKLMAFLSAMYGTYTLSNVKEVLDSLFDELYSLDIHEEVETRELKEFNEETGEYEEVSYEYYILYVTLTKNDWESVIEGKFLDEEIKKLYAIYIDTGGAHQSFHNPFTLDWSEYVSSEFGWRIHPITGEEKFHNGIDIALPEGTEILACSTGTVIQSYVSESAGNYVVIEDDTGYTCHYMHLESRSVALGELVQYGDVIGKLGNTGNSTGPHLHLGIKDNTGEWLNPRFMVSTFIRE